MTTQTRNEAAEHGPTDSTFLTILCRCGGMHPVDVFMDAERRATVERIRAEARRQRIYSPTWDAILDKEAAR